MVIAGGAQEAQPGHYFGGSRLNRGIGRLPQDADTTFLGERASGPAVFPVSRKPSVRLVVVHMSGIEQGDGHVDIPQSWAVAKFVDQGEPRLSGPRFRSEQKRAVAGLSPGTSSPGTAAPDRKSLGPSSRGVAAPVAWPRSRCRRQGPRSSAYVYGRTSSITSLDLALSDAAGSNRA